MDVGILTQILCNANNRNKNNNNKSDNNKKIIIRDWKLEVSTNLNRINFIVCSLSQIRHAIHKNFSFVVPWVDGWMDGYTD